MTHARTLADGPAQRARAALYCILLAVALLVSGCATANRQQTGSASPHESALPTTGGAPANDLDAAQVNPLVAALGSRPGADLAAARLGEGLTPPTNRWFSGLVFGTTPQPVFPMPLSFGLTSSGFAFGLPEVSTSPSTIQGAYHPAVTVGLGAVSWKLTRYDEMSITLTASSTDGDLGTVTLAEGSPFVTFTAKGERTLTTDLATRQEADQWVSDDGTDSYVFVGKGLSVSGTRITIQDGDHVSWYAVPTGGNLHQLAELAASPLTGTTTGYQVGTSTTTTTLGYTTADHSPTAFAVLPHQQGSLTGADCSLGSYPSILGEMKLCSGRSFTWSEPRQQAKAALDLSDLSEEQRTALRAQVVTDTADLPAYPTDTYFAGKALYRDAQLYTIAEQVGAGAQAATLKRRIVDELTGWTDPSGCGQRTSQCFYYDSTNKGIVGLDWSFGSEQFNDHHFHYGYFLYAAGVMAHDDPSLVPILRPVMTLLAADIASPTDTGTFPQRRVFDPYVSHSWASGTAPFADANNQESVSEAINAWAGLSLWAKAASDRTLEDEAQWMQSLETASSLAYWTDFDTSAPVYQGFAHQITPLNWGGKRDYATWFSPEPAAALAILLIPMSPSSGYLRTNPQRIAANLAQALGTKGYQQTYGDLLLLYGAGQGPAQREDAMTKVGSLTSIDDSMTRSYLIAYLDALRF